MVAPPVTVVPEHRPAPGALPPFARRAVPAVAVVLALAHGAVVVARPGAWFDELLMLAIGRHHLDWGSADQPPVAPVLAALTDAIAPGSGLVRAVPAILATVGAVVVAALIARELGGDGRAQTLTALAQATGLWVGLTGHWLTPYALEPVQWLLVVWLLLRWCRVRDDRLLLVLGLVVGIAAETKFQVLLLCAVLALAVLVLGPRELLRRPLLWAGAGVALLITAPTLVWQALNGWPQLRMGSIVASEAEELYQGRPGIAVALVLCAGAMGTVLALYGLGRLLVAPEMRALRFLGVTAVVLYVLFVVTAGRPYYLQGLHGVLVAAGALGLQRRREAGGRRWRWVAWPAVALSVVVAGGALASSTVLAAPAVPESFARTAAETYGALPPEQRDRTALIGDSYIAAAFLDAYSTRYGLPEAHSTNRSYGYFDPPPPQQDQVLYVGADVDELRPWFADIRPVRVTGSDSDVWLCRGQRAPWTELWPRLRHLAVI